MSINVVTISGRLTANPEVRVLPSGSKVVSFSVAVESRKKDEQTGKREAYFINCVAWSSQAEYIGKYASKGSLLILSGYLSQTTYTRKVDGTQHTSIQVVCENVVIPSFKTKSEISSISPAPTGQVVTGKGFNGDSYPDADSFIADLGDDDLPF